MIPKSDPSRQKSSPCKAVAKGSQTANQLVPNAFDVSVAFEETETALVVPFSLGHNKEQYTVPGLLEQGSV